MSYNYLPLDRKPLNFQQVKNLLDFDQLVSITFDAHERILQCRDYVNRLPTEENLSSIAGENELLQQNAVGLGDESPEALVRLMLMLKIKSLSYGHSGVHIETVKRLLEMYNNQILPVVYASGSLPTSASAALSHLCLPLIGKGEVYYEGQKLPASKVLAVMNWKPLRLDTFEAAALTSGSQCTIASGLYALKKTEHLLRVSLLISALSCCVFECAIGQVETNAQVATRGEGYNDTMALLRQYLSGATSGTNRKDSTRDPASFTAIPEVHGLYKDQYDHVLKILLLEINRPSEKLLIYPDKELVTDNSSNSGYSIAFAFGQLSSASVGIGTLSSIRTRHLLSGKRGLRILPGPDDNNGAILKSLGSTAASLAKWNTQVVKPAGVAFEEDDENIGILKIQEAVAGNKYLQLIEYLEKIFAIELLAAVQAFKYREAVPTSLILNKLVEDFNRFSAAATIELPRDEIVNAIQFMRYSIHLSKMTRPINSI